MAGTGTLTAEVEFWRSDKKARCYSATDRHRRRVVDKSRVVFKYCEFGLQSCAFYRRRNRESVLFDMRLLELDYRRRRTQGRAAGRNNTLETLMREDFVRRTQALQQVLKLWHEPHNSTQLGLLWRQTICNTQRLRRRFLLRCMT